MLEFLVGMFVVAPALTLAGMVIKVKWIQFTSVNPMEMKKQLEETRLIVDDLRKKNSNE